jgi:hypothetical protein
VGMNCAGPPDADVVALPPAQLGDPKKLRRLLVAAGAPLLASAAVAVAAAAAAAAVAAAGAVIPVIGAPLANARTAHASPGPLLARCGVR